MTDRFAEEDVARLRVALGRISRLIDRQVSGGGLTRSQLSVLGTASRLGPLGVSELADIEGINPTMLSRLIAKLADAGLVRRRPDATDGRAVMVEVTAAGARLHHKLRAERTELLTLRLAGLPEGRAAELVAALPALEALSEQMAHPTTAAHGRARVGGAAS